MPTAISTDTLPSKISQRAEATASKTRADQVTDVGAGAGNPVNSFTGKTFGELTQPAKDNLLKALALQAGLIEPDGS